MPGLALSFLLGDLLLQQAAVLPDLAWCALLPALPVVYCRSRLLRLPAGVGMGLLWALLQAHVQLPTPLPLDLEGEDLEVVGVVASIPEVRPRSHRFQLDVKEVLGPPAAVGTLPDRLRLSWYGDHPPLRVGERWRLRVRLKRPRGFMNPGGFDYEGWLYREGIGATGYVRSEGPNRQLGRAGQRYQLDRTRQALADNIVHVLHDDPGGASIIKALAIGVRGDIPQTRWDTLIATGTNHLVAISGLHIGLIAGLAYLLGRRAWPIMPAAALRWPAPRVVAALAILAAGLYALLAGFALPTQRALTMVAVAFGATLLGRGLRPAHGLSVALLAVLLVDAQAPLSPGFWLSFGAVAVIIYGMRGSGLARQRRVVQWLRVQWVVALGLMPILLWFFQRGPLIAPVANILAVPWVGLVVVPLSLLGASLTTISETIAAPVLELASLALDPFWHLLSGLAGLPHTSWEQHRPVFWSLPLAGLGIFLLLAPRGWPARWLGLLFLLPMLLRGPMPPPYGGYRVAVLDVGQGLAAVVRTRSHVLVYDTGPRYSPRFDTGRAVLVPFLHAHGLRAIDILAISHGDNDHIGGAESVLSAMPVHAVVTSAVGAVDHPRVSRCQADDAWRWDGVEFRWLHPDDADSLQGNEGSCVLRVTGEAGSILLTGDIGARAERALIQRAGRLDSDALLVPHHGSKGSSSAALLDAVEPQVALLSYGARNRFGFPDAEVVRRYRRRDIELLRTPSRGAITLSFQNGELEWGRGYRLEARRYWHRGGDPG